MDKINDHQKELYETFSSNGSELHLSRYLPHLKEYENRKNLKILDIGGATGHFAYLLKKHFKNSKVEIYVVDMTEYYTWEESSFGNDIHFICDSVENLKILFEENSFDLIFANRVFHHFVQSSWRKSLNSMDEYMHTIRTLLKNDGLFCVMDHFYNGAIIDSSSSFLIYTLTSIKNPYIAKIVKNLGAESAGVGTCFLSKRMWITKLIRAGFDIAHIENAKSDRITAVKRMLMFKEASQNNLIFATSNKCE